MFGGRQCRSLSSLFRYLDIVTGQMAQRVSELELEAEALRQRGLELAASAAPGTAADIHDSP